MAITNHERIDGGGKNLVRETGKFTFAAAAQDGELPTTLSRIIDARFTAVVGTGAWSTADAACVIKEVMGTQSSPDMDGVVAGTSITVTRDGTVGEVNFFYTLEGYR